MQALTDLDDDKFDAIFQGLKKWSPEEQSKYCDELGEHPLFQSPFNPNAAFNGTSADAGTDSAMAAIENIEYDEIDSPANMAREYKEKGNTAFQGGKTFYANAIKHYNDAIKHAQKEIMTSQDRIHEIDNNTDEEKAEKLVEEREKMTEMIKEMRSIASVCYSNLAAVYMARIKYISVIDSCEKALRLWNENIKACWRAAKACLALGRAEEALQFCEMGRLIDPETKSFDAMAKEGVDMINRQERAAEHARAVKKKRDDQLDAVRKACIERNIKVGPPLFRDMKRTDKDPYVDEYGCIQWPVVVLFPETGQSDYIEEVPEVAAISNVVDMLLPPGDGQPPLHVPTNYRGPRRLPWDTKGEYTQDNVEVFFKSNPCKPIPMEQAWTADASSEVPEESWKSIRWVRIPMNSPIMLALIQDSYIVTDIPIFYVVAKTSSFYQQMLKAAGGKFATFEVPDFELPSE